MQTSSIWRKIPLLRNPISSSLQSALFHSTPISLAKGKNKDHIRYAVRQKRADTKKALKSFFVYGDYSKASSQDDRFNWSSENSNQNAKTKNQRFGSSKPNSSSSFGKGKRKGWRRKQQKYDLDNDDIPSNIFEATFGGQKCYSWSFTWSENFDFTSGFGLGSGSRWEKAWKREFSESDIDEDDSTYVGSRIQRNTLGLPLTGPLKLDDVKSAFRASALKWHPDKHQGPSQAMAEEKFKLCVNAYNSLCSALKPS